MKPIDRLDTSVHALLDAGETLREERERDSRDLGELRRELVEARETIADLRHNLEALDGGRKKDRGHGARKKVIVERIQTLISRLDSLVHIENVTNDRQ